MFVGVFDYYDGCVDYCVDGDGDVVQVYDVCFDVEYVYCCEGYQDVDWKYDDCYESVFDMYEEDYGYDCDDD